MSKATVAAAVVIAVVALLILVTVLGGLTEDATEETPSRYETIPEDAVKRVPQTDLYPPVLHSDEWSDPVPMPGAINTAGAEDSPFISPDGERFFFFFTPDVRVPPEKQLLDKVTGIWWCNMVNGSWTEPERIILSDDLSLDGAEFVLGDTMWFASVRVGNYREIDYYTAELEDGEWKNVENVGQQLNVEYGIGEMHITSDGNTMYFHKGEYSGTNDMDLYMTTRTSDGWSEPVEVPGVNTDAVEGYPFISADGNELWYTGTSKLGHPGPALYRAIKNGTGWGEAEEIVSSFAGECTMDAQGNLYFVHHYFDGDMNMIEADIYVAYKSQRSVSVSAEDKCSEASLPAFHMDLSERSTPSAEIDCRASTRAIHSAEKRYTLIPGHQIR
jgi:hypothetical protein